jgi:mannose-6-phosphate isomerase-like protein (cupin superfamily)
MKEESIEYMGYTLSVKKPWGGYTDYFRSDRVVFKKIVILPGEEISYQMHSKRSEFWYVIEGTGLLRWNNVNNWKVAPGFTIEIRKNDSHQLINTGDIDLVVYEMQFGECSEDDIVRMEDKYERSEDNE